MVDWTAVLIVTGLCVVMPIVVTGIVFRSKEHEINRKTDVLLKAVENCQEIDPALFTGSGNGKTLFTGSGNGKTLKMKLLNKLTWGMVLFVIGVGMLVGGPFADDPKGFVITGGIMTAVGAGLLAAFFVGRKWMRPEIKAEENAFMSEGKDSEKEI